MDPGWKCSPHQGQRSDRRNPLEGQPHHRRNAEIYWRTWNQMWGTAKEPVVLPVSFCSYPGSRNGQASYRWSMCCLAGAIVTIIAHPKRWCTEEYADGQPAVFWMPSTPSPRTGGGDVRKDCRWYAGCPAGAADTITLNGKRETGHESGLADQGLLDSRSKRCAGRAASDLAPQR